MSVDKPKSELTSEQKAFLEARDEYEANPDGLAQTSAVRTGIMIDETKRQLGVARITEQNA